MQKILTSFIRFWNYCNFKHKFGVVVSAVVAIALIVTCFVYPLFGLGLLAFAAAVGIIWGIIWTVDAIDEYRYYR